MRKRTGFVAALLIVASFATLARADGVTPEQASPIQREQAQARFTRGKEAFKKKKFTEALQELRASQEIISSPNTRLMIARCLRELDRLVEAYAELGRTEIEAKELIRVDRRYEQAAETADQERRQLESRLGFVTIEVRNSSTNTVLRVGSEQIRRAAWSEPAPVMPGTTSIVVETPGQAPVAKIITLTAGERLSVTLMAAPDAPTPAEAVKPTASASVSSSNTLRPWAYVAGGIGLAGLTTFAIAGSMSSSTYSDLESACGSGPCPPNQQGSVDQGKREQRIANIGLVVGALGVATGVTLFVLSKPKTSSTTSASVVVSPAWVGIQGQM